MPTTAVPLEDLAQRIARQESQLEALRREYQARQEQLTTLTQRKHELEAQLRQVESEIDAIAHRGKQPGAVTASEVTPGTSSAAMPKAKTTDVRLPDLIVTILREANGQPISLRRLRDEVMRRGFSTTSRNLYKLVKVRAAELVKKAVLRRAPDGAGLLLAKETRAPATAARKPAPPAKAPGRARKPARSPSSPRNGAAPIASKRTPASAPKEQRPLHEVLLAILKKSKRPMLAKELGAEALKAGYRTASKDFTNVVWVNVGKMPEVERAPDGGYRLKKAKK
jgi:hypothetical protein